MTESEYIQMSPYFLQRNVWTIYTILLQNIHFIMSK